MRRAVARVMKGARQRSVCGPGSTRARLRYGLSCPSGRAGSARARSVRGDPLTATIDDNVSSLTCPGRTYDPLFPPRAGTESRMPAHPVPVRGAWCGLPLMQAVDVQFPPASQIPDLLVYGGGGGLAERGVLVDRSTPGRPAFRSAVASSVPASRSPCKVGNAKYPPVLGGRLGHLQLIVEPEDPPPDVHRSCSSTRRPAASRPDAPAGLCLGGPPGASAPSR
jgi:hypothetical protein